MQIKHFYFLNDEYYKDFPDPFLMNNHEVINGRKHDRPCFYSFKDKETGLFWMIPLSSKISKYQKIYDSKIRKNGKCDTIVFGNFLGFKKAFLIQNMCPIIDYYIQNEYYDINNKPVRIDALLETELTQKAKKILALQRKGIKLIYPDVLLIESKLLKK